jgi:hypothetical protein
MREKGANTSWKNKIGERCKNNGNPVKILVAPGSKEKILALRCVN